MSAVFVWIFFSQLYHLFPTEIKIVKNINIMLQEIYLTFVPVYVFIQTKYINSTAIVISYILVFIEAQHMHNI